MEAVDLNLEELQEESPSVMELFFNVLGLVSPGFIESMTAFSEGGKQDPLVDALSDYLDLELKSGKDQSSAVEGTGRAKILPFTKIDKEKDNNPLEGSSTSSFIFREKKRSEKVQRKIKGQEIIELYQKSSQVNVKQEKALKDDLSKSYKVGILINKRQY